jgi:uracil-DNA glycosylase family 4
MDGSTAVLGDSNGDVQSHVMFVAEAPGRLGAARTGIPLYGDQSGRNFDRLLRAAELSRADIFITNAVLCNPRDRFGRNAIPSTTEQRNCLPYLRRTLDIVDPRIVVTLGTIALRSLGRIESHGLTLRDHVGVPCFWYGRLLIPLYHPSPRAQIHRSFATQLEDFSALRSVIQQLSRST